MKSGSVSVLQVCGEFLVGLLQSLVSDLFGPLGSFFRSGFLGLFGAGAILFPVLFIYSAVMLFIKDNRVISKSLFSGAFTLFFAAFYNVIAYSIAESAKANNLRPYYYYKHLLSELPNRMDDNGNIDTATLDDLMPWADGLPEECYKRR